LNIDGLGIQYSATDKTTDVAIENVAPGLALRQITFSGLTPSASSVVVISVISTVGTVIADTPG
jgi:hypothetical protein